ncbi:CAP domain-containing protein [Sphingomonas sp.]|uniref:CAP domain-containing protein n=1 Tax=Sphingomonas sp. TaxID=28214 RepID=UPI0039C9E34D
MAWMRIKRHPVAALLLSACAAEGPERVVERRTSSAPADRGAALLRSAMVEGHARERSSAGVAPLAWDDALAADALVYAKEMAHTGRFEHAEQPHDIGRQGENLWTGTRGAYAYAEMFGHWAAEKRDFVNGVTPAFSRTGRWQDVSHYTQIVWRTSTRLGCALASNATDDYVVCRYSPTGNVVGKRTL